MESAAQGLPLPGQHPGVPKLPALTGLRFVAAAMIVLHHSRGMFAVPKEFLSHFALQQGVAFFFVLSGFILAYVYPTLTDGRARVRFLVTRVARIWPAHLATFGLTLALGVSLTADTQTKPDAVITAANVAMVHAWVPATAWFFSFNSVSWSISTEFFFYLAFPLLIAGFTRHWWWKAMLCVGLLVVMVSLCTQLNIPRYADAAPREVNRAGVLYIGPLARLAEFALGMVMALWWRKRAPFSRLTVAAGTALEVLALAGCAALVVAMSNRQAVTAWFGSVWMPYLHNAGAAPAFALLIVVFAAQRGWLSRACGRPRMVLLGEISFSVYLLHQIFLRWSEEHRAVWKVLGGGVAYGVYWAALLLASWLLWKLVEIPARRWLLRLTLR